MTVTRRFGFDGLAIDVTAAAAPLGWLEEFLTPQFDLLDAAPASPPHARVALVEDAALHDALLAAGPRAGAEPVDGFALDNSVVPFVPWSTPDGSALFRDPQFPVLYRLARERGPGGASIARFDLIATGREITVRTPFMRVVREVAMGWSLRRGGLFLHASAVAFAGRALVVAGTKAAGKTTLLLHLLRQPGAAYVSNDRILVRRTGEVHAIRGMPTIATVRPGTLELLPELAARLAASAFHHRLSLAEIAAHGAAPTAPWSDGRRGLSPAQLLCWTGASARAGAELGALGFPLVTGEAGAIEVERIAPDDAATRLGDALFGARTWRKSSDAFAVGDDTALPEPRALEERCRALTTRAPCWEIRLGRAAYEDAPATTRALERLLG